MKTIFRKLAPHEKRHPAVAVNARGGAGALIAFFQQITEPESLGVDVMVLHHVRGVLASHAAIHGAQHIFAVLAAAQVMSMRPQFGGELPGQFKYVTADHQISAAGNGPFLRGDRLGLVRLVVARNGQRINPVGSIVMHPFGLAAVPVGQDAAAIQPRVRPGCGGLFDGDQVVFIDPVIVVDEGGEFGVNFGNGAIQRMRFAGGGHFN